MNLKNRYLGSKMGILWAVLQPLMMMIMYIFVFGVIFKSTVEGSDSSIDYVIWFLCGFSPWMAISEGIATTASSIIAGVNLIKNFTIKGEYIVIAAALMGFPQMIVGILIILILSLISGLGLSWTIIWLIPATIVMFCLISGVGLFLSASAVFNRDIIQILPTIIQLAFYFTPIFYNASQITPILEKVSLFNPIYQIVDCFRNILFYHRNPDIVGIIYLLLLAMFFLILGIKYFRRLEGYFESVL